MTLASDVLVLGAAFSFIGVVLKSFLPHAKDYLPVPMRATLGGTKRCVGEDGGLCSEDTINEHGSLNVAR